MVRGHWANALLVLVAAFALAIRIDKIEIEFTGLDILLHHGVSNGHTTLDVISRIAFAMLARLDH